MLSRKVMKFFIILSECLKISKIARGMKKNLHSGVRWEEEPVFRCWK